MGDNAIPGVRGLAIAGCTFGVWAVGTTAPLCVVAAEAGLTRGADAPVTFGRASEVVITEQQRRLLVIEPKLELAITGVTRIGKKATIAGKTSALAELFLDRGSGFEQLPLNAAGTFTFEIEANEVPAGALVAVDALGRRAEPNRPSSSLEELLSTMGAADPSARADGPATPRPSPAAAAPPPAKEEGEAAPPPPASPPEEEATPPPPTKAEVKTPAKAEVKTPAKPEVKTPAKPEVKTPAKTEVKTSAKSPPPGPSLPSEPPAAKVPGPKTPPADEVTDDDEDPEPPARPAEPPPAPPKPAPKEAAEDESAIDEDQL